MLPERVKKRILAAIINSPGTGEFAALLARAGAYVTAVDIDEGSVQLTQETARKFGVSVKGEVATLQSFVKTEQFAWWPRLM